MSEGNTSYKKSLTLNAFLNTLRTVIGIVFPLITFPYVSRVLQVEAIGVYNFSNSIVSYFLLIAGLGISTYAIREGTQYRNQEGEFQKFVSEVFSINVISTVISYFLLALCCFVITKLHNYWLAISLLSIQMALTTLGAGWICNIVEDFLFIAVRQVAIQIVTLVLTFLLVHSPDDLYKYIILIVISSSLSNVWNFFYLRKKYCKFKFSFHLNLKKHLKPILIIFSTNIAITIYLSSDSTMIGFLQDDIQVGLYSTSVKIYSIVKNVLAATVAVLIPRFSILYAENKKNDACQLFSKISDVLLMFVLPATIGIFMESDEVIMLIAGSSYLNASFSLRILCFAIFFSLYGYLYTQCILIPLKKESVVFWATFASALINIGLNFLAIPFWGINGAAVTTVLAELLVWIISYIYAKNIVKLTFKIRNMISVLIGCALIALSCMVVNHYFSIMSLRIILSISLSVIIYVLTLLFMKNSSALSYLNLLKAKIRR